MRDARSLAAQTHVLFSALASRLCASRPCLFVVFGLRGSAALATRTIAQFLHAVGNAAAVAVELDTAVIEGADLGDNIVAPGASIEALSSNLIADGLLPLYGALVSPGVIPALAVLIVLCYRFFTHGRVSNR